MSGIRTRRQGGGRQGGGRQGGDRQGGGRQGGGRQAGREGAGARTVRVGMNLQHRAHDVRSLRRR